MLSWMIAASLGIAVVSWFPVLPPLSLLIFLILPVLIALYRCKAGSRHFVLCLLCAFLLGNTLGVLYGHHLVDELLPDAWQGEDVRLEGTIIGFPDSDQRGRQTIQRFEVSVSKLCFDRVCLERPQKIRLRWYGKNEKLNAGERWQLLVRLKRPWGMANPGGFDYQSWLISRGIGAVGYVRDSSTNQLLSIEKLSIDHLRGSLNENISHVFDDPEIHYGAIIQALLLGNKQAIDPALWDLFATTGTTHLMVISGLHVGLIATLCFYFGRSLAMLLLPAVAPERWGALFGVSGAAFYALMAGFSLPTQRALIMISVWMLMIFFHRHLSVAAGLALALLVCLVIDPLAPVSASFWLSFGAVAVIFSGSIGRRQSSISLSRKFITHYLVFIGLLPVLAIVIAQVSLVSPLANVLLVPVYSVFVVPLNFVALLLNFIHSDMALWLWRLVDSCIGISFTYLDALVSIDNAVVFIPSIPLVLQFLSILGVLILLLPKGVPFKYLGLLLVLPLFFYQSPKVAVGDLSLTVLDVGQGLSVVVQTHNHVLVYDVGAKLNEDFSVAQATVWPFLRGRGIRQVDKMVLSHGDNDHAGGWADLMRHIPVRDIIYGEFDHEYPKRASQCLRGQKWVWDGVAFEFIYPHDNAQPKNANNSSCVLTITAGNTRFMLPGDIEDRVERKLVADYSSALRSLSATVLIAPHHGSSSSSSSAFLKAVDMQHVVFSSGYRNRFNHPNPEVISRYQRFDALTHSTNKVGAVSFYVKDGLIDQISHFRRLNQRYWLTSE